MRPAREVLTIFVDGEEVSGFIVYGLSALGTWTEKPFPYGIWPPGTHASEFRLRGNAWEVLAWEVAVSEWPTGASWILAVRTTLTWLGLKGFHSVTLLIFSHPTACRAAFWRHLRRLGNFSAQVIQIPQYLPSMTRR